MTDKFTSRKFFLVVGTQLLLFICLATGTLPADVFQSITMVLITSYIAGNVSQRVLTKDKTNDTTS